MGYRIVRKPNKSYIVRSGANYYAPDDIALQNSLGTTTQDYYGALVNTVYGLIYIGNDTYLVATADLEMVGDVSDYNQIQSMDDITPIRYGYGNQNGYVIGIGTELNGTYENGVFTVGSGLAVVQGVEIDIDANGITTALDTANETRYYKIYLEVNFNRAINLYNATLKSYYSTVSYDEIQDPTFGELRNNQTAYLELYRIKLNGATEIEKSKNVNEVKYNITDAETINGLSITQDNNNVLHVGNEIITKKKLLWSGNVSISSIVPVSICSLSKPLSTNAKAIEIVCVSAINGNYSIKIPLNTSSMMSGSYIIDYGFYPSVSVPYFSYIKLMVQYSSSNNTIYGECFESTYYISNQTTDSSGTTMAVTKIYEIIE